MRFRFIKLSLLLCVVVASVTAQKNNQYVSISGTLKNFSNAVQVQDMSEFEYLKPLTNARMIIPDSNGHFNIRFQITSPNYSRIGRNILYLKPGDSLNVIIDFLNPKTASFSGSGSAANLYLRNTPFPKAGSFIEGGRNIKQNPLATINTILQIAELRRKQLDELEDVSAIFKKLEAARIRAGIINSLKMGGGYSAYMLKLEGDTAKKYLKRYSALAKPVIASYSKGFVDPAFMKIEVYRDIADDLTGGNKDDVQKIEDWYKASSLVQKMQGSNSREQLQYLQSEIASIHTTSYREAAKLMLRHLLQFGEGDRAADFTATDINGNKVTLSSLKGKIIYLDLWATWCGPCLKEMPYFEKLKKQYKDNPKVVFVSLSIDDNTSAWHKNVKLRNAGDYQWNINRNKLTAYNIVGIPRVLLIDKDFKMADMNAPPPSFPKVTEAINKLLK